MGVVLVAVAVIAAVVVAVVAQGGGETSSAADYQAAVVNARDRVDFALERISKSRSPDELVSRINDASNIADATARELVEVDAPSELSAGNDRLVRTLRAFSDELAGTAGTLSDPSFAGSLAGLTSLSFKQWDALNRVFVELRSKGIRVQPLARH